MNHPYSPSLATPRYVKARILAFGAAIAAVLSGAVLASSPVVVVAPPPPPPPPQPKLRFTVDDRPERFEDTFDAIFDDHAPHHPANLITDGAVTRVVDRLRELRTRGATAGAESKETKTVAPTESMNFSAYGEYSYLTSNDKRELGMDSITNAGSGGFDLTLGDTLVGLIYYYSHMSGSSEFLKSNSSSDSNFVSFYVAQPILPWLSIGVTGGYGHTDVEVRLRRKGDRRPSQQSSDTDAWTGSPFVSFAYATGNCYASLTTTYQYLHTDSDDSGKLNIQIAAGYHFAEWIAAEINGKFSQMLHNTRAGEPEDDNWYSVGAKVKEFITPNFGAYQAYEFNVNDSFEEHMITAGLTYSF